MTKRERMTWAGRTAGNPPATPGYNVEDQDHPAHQKEPEAHKYENGDTSQWAEDVRKGPYPQGNPPATPGYNVEDQDHPAHIKQPNWPQISPQENGKQAADIREQVIAKAARAMRLARLFLAGKKGVTSAMIEDQAVDFMDLSPAAITAMEERYAGGFLAGEDEDKVDEALKDEGKKADDMPDFIKQKIEDKKKDDGKKAEEVEEEVKEEDEGKKATDARLAKLESMFEQVLAKLAGQNADISHPPFLNKSGEDEAAARKPDVKPDTVKQKDPSGNEGDSPSIAEVESGKAPIEGGGKKAAKKADLPPEFLEQQKKKKDEGKGKKAEEVEEEVKEEDEGKKAEESEEEEQDEGKKAALQMFASLGGNSDGFAKKASWKGNKAIFASIDTDKDGIITAAEFVAQMTGKACGPMAEPEAAPTIMAEPELDESAMFGGPADPMADGDDDSLLNEIFGGKNAEEVEEEVKEEDEGKKAEEEDDVSFDEDEGKKAEEEEPMPEEKAKQASRTASQRPQPRAKPTNAGARGRTASTVEAGDELSKLWESAPDVSAVFGS